MVHRCLHDLPRHLRPRPYLLQCRFLGLLHDVDGGYGALADSLDVLRHEVRIFVFDDLAHPDLGEFLGDELGVEEAPFGRLFVLYEGGDHLVEVFLTDALALGCLRLGDALDLDVELTGFRVVAEIGFVLLVALLTVVVAILRAAIRISWA